MKQYCSTFEATTLACQAYSFFFFFMLFGTYELIENWWRK